MDLPINKDEHQVALARNLSVQQSPAGAFAATCTDVTQRCLKFQFIAWAYLPAETSTIQSTEQREL
jgi:hypothetical protein